MIIVLISIALIIIGIIGFNLFENEATALLTAIGVVCSLISILMIIGNHIMCHSQQIKWENRYNGLIYKQENIDKLNITGLELVNEIVEYNDDYDSFVYWSNNPWTNWLYVKDEIANVGRVDFKEELYRNNNITQK